AAGLHRLAVDQDGARGALARVARDMRPGESGHLAQVVDEEEARLDVVLPPPSIDGHCNRLRHGHPPGQKGNEGGPMLAFAEGKGQAPVDTAMVKVHNGAHLISSRLGGLTWVAGSNSRVAPQSHSS